MRRLLPLLTLAACAHGTQPLPPVAPPTDVAGSWVEVSADAPAGPHVIARCWPSYTSIEFATAGGVVRAKGHRSGYGVQPPPWPLALEGRWTRNGLVLEGSDGGYGRREGPTRWALAYDAASGHLTGSIDGAPAHLARLEVASPPAESCGAPPP